MKTPLIDTKRIGLMLLIAFVGGFVAIGAYKWFEKDYDYTSSFDEKQKAYFTKNPMPIINADGFPDFTAAAAAVTPAVVHITTTYNHANSQFPDDPFDGFFDDFFRRRMPHQQQRQAKATGSGVIIADDGYIITNNHVVENADKIEVSLTDKRSFSAKVIGTDPNTDLALLKINGKDLPIVKMGNSDELKVGEWVLAIGNPFNLHSTVTAGIVSAKARSIGIIGNDLDPEDPKRHPIESFIQTDAAINKGNSGGALVNTRGELVGINAAIASQSGAYEGYGFAIPINLARKIMDDFMKFGSVKRGFLGASITEINTDFAKEKGLNSTKGVYIASILENGAAKEAGLKEGDVIVKIENTDINSVPQLMEKIGGYRPGDKISLHIIREGKEKKITATLKGEEENLVTENGKNKSVEEIYNKLGASFGTLSDIQKRKHQLNGGVVVTEVRPGRLFDQMDIQKGTIITQINGKSINHTNDIDGALIAGKKDFIQIVGIAPDGANITYQFQVR